MRREPLAAARPARSPAHSQLGHTDRSGRGNASAWQPAGAACGRTMCEFALLNVGAVINKEAPTRRSGRSMAGLCVAARSGVEGG